MGFDTITWKRSLNAGALVLCFGGLSCGLSQHAIAQAACAFAPGSTGTSTVPTGAGSLNCGVSAGRSSTGIANSAFGQSAGANVAGESNTAVGSSSGSALFVGNVNTGNRNTSVGANAGNDVVGDENIALGYNAGRNLGNTTTKASNNISIGSVAGGFPASGTDPNPAVSNTISIGTQAKAGGSNSIAIGNNVRSGENTVAIGNTANTYTLAGVTSDASRAKQTFAGLPQVVTTDAFGNLASDGGAVVQSLGTLLLGQQDLRSRFLSVESNIRSLDNRINKANEGIAIALSLSTPPFHAGQTFVIQGGWGNFEGTDAFGFSAAGLISRDTFGPGSTVTLTGGIGAGTNEGTVAGRAAVAIGW